MLVTCERPEQWCHIRPGAAVVLSGERFRRDEAQCHLLWLAPDGSLAARCSLWWTDTPRLQGRAVGAIGHYAAADLITAQRLLAAAAQSLQRLGCAVAVGPLDGNTWRSYRLVSERNEYPPFYFEPDHPADWPAHFAAAGFTVLANYRSSLCDDLSVQDTRVERAWRRLRAA